MPLGERHPSATGPSCSQGKRLPTAPIRRYSIDVVLPPNCCVELESRYGHLSVATAHIRICRCRLYAMAAADERGCAADNG
jgi:hypothetical protein